MKSLPTAVLDSLRTWSNKRERPTVYASAALFEFANADEMTEAIARGLPAQWLTDRLAVVASEKDIDFRHFRLTGTRDYCLPPEQCVEVEVDGVTLNVDLVRSDLLLEIEVQRFAELATGAGLHGRASLSPHTLLAGGGPATGSDSSVFGPLVRSTAPVLAITRGTIAPHGCGVAAARVAANSCSTSPVLTSPTACSNGQEKRAA